MNFNLLQPHRHILNEHLKEEEKERKPEKSTSESFFVSMTRNTFEKRKSERQNRKGLSCLFAKHSEKVSKFRNEAKEREKCVKWEKTK